MYAVVVGDSIAEGEPAGKGRLNMMGRFVPDLLSRPGQLSYELAQRSGVFHYNHGMGGQGCALVRARWRRDVLAEESDPLDGRGPRTLPAGTRPVLAYLHVGINDVAYSVPLQQMQDAFLYFAASTARHGITLVVDNIGAFQGMHGAMLEQALAFNAWLRDTLVPRHPHMAWVDYADWSTGGSGDLGRPAEGRLVDGLHPSARGYADFARYACQRLSLPATAALRYR
ncbi:SGNH/GDSL hydrolase family protein [Xylophilus sp.]|uniref:SGNH/GDSL hydrolase family protein n=1 Tax=Xylophilus sp. TaxID=2653893 RepID=UPI0013BE52AE|nr:SGNH/GDSL hydrolase family protein [Xylophilus sp.]KAF1050039.1 MAG: hypothetical protein GAK38_00063 [Xylophilus sp.]